MTWVMATDSAAATGGRAGITFDVELVVPWDALETVVDLHSDGVVKLDTVPDVLDLTGREPLWFGSYKDEMCGVCVPWFQIRGCWSGVS